MKTQLGKALKVLVVLIVTQFLYCPTVKYDNPTDGIGGLMFQLFSTLRQSSNVSSTGLTGLSVTNAPTSITENQSVEISISFSTTISADTTITLSSNNAAITINGSNTAVLSFQTSNATIAQKVTLAAVDDANLISEAVKITLSAPGYIDAVVDLTATDDDAQNISITGTTTLNEGGNGTISVSLTKEPASDVTVSLSSSDTSSLTLGAASLTFTAANYNTPQVVAVNSLQDVNQNSETVVITATSSGITTNTWNIICIEDDTTIVFTGGNSVTEGSTLTLSITLSGNPGTTRTVNFSSNNTASATVSPTSMTFTTGNYSSSQTLTVTGVNEANIIAESITITASGTGLVSATKTVTTVDNDTMNISLGGTTTVNEGGTSTMTVVLTNDPSGSLTVNLSSADTSSVSVPASVTFTSANYSTQQNVTITGVEDANQSSETVTITASASGVTSQTRNIIAIENDTTIVFTGGSSVNEGGNISLNITLSGNPGTSRTVDIVSNNTSSLTISPSTMTFTTANWNSAQTLTVTGANEANVIAETVTLTASGTGLITNTKTITTVDNDTMLITLGGATTVNEGGTSTMTVVLTQDPSGSLTVNLNSANTASVSIPASVTFTSANYATPQNVTITGVEDVNQTSETVTITASASGVVDQTRSISTIENDTTPVFAGATSVTEGNTASMTVALSGNPGTSRTITLTSNNTTYLTLSPSVLTFTTSNWNSGQVVTLTGVLDTNHTNDSTSVTATGAEIVSSTSSSITITDASCHVWGCFDENNNGTVSFAGAGTYAGTNLIWMKCMQGQTYDVSSKTCTGSSAVYPYCTSLSNACDSGNMSTVGTLTSGFAYDTCNSLNTSPSGGYAGKTTWRVPTVEELKSLVYCSNGPNNPLSTNTSCTFGYSSPTINKAFFPDAPSSFNWSSSTKISSTMSAFVVSFGDGWNVGTDKTQTFSIRCVATGP